MPQTQSISEPVAESASFGTGVLQAVLLAVLLAAITLGLYAPTIGNSFFTIDDGDVVVRSARIAGRMASGDVLYAWDRTSHGYGARYFPSYFVYQAMRVWAFGTDPVLWRFGHHFALGLLGAAMALYGRRLTGSILPGAAAYVIAVGTHSQHYQSNAYNFYNLNTIEPMIMQLWGLCALLIVLTERAAGRWWQWPVAALAGGLLVLTTMMKETNSLVHIAVLAPLLLAANLRVFREGGLVLGRVSQAALAIGLLGALWWLWVVVSGMPKGDSYGGAASLVKAPVAWVRMALQYLRDWVNASHLLVPIGLIAFASCVVRGDLRGRWAPLALLAWLGLMQLGSLTVWPDFLPRLAFPAYYAALFLAMLGIWKTAATIAHPAVRSPHLRHAGVVAIVVGVVFFGAFAWGDRAHHVAVMGVAVLVLAATCLVHVAMQRPVVGWVRTLCAAAALWLGAAGTVGGWVTRQNYQTSYTTVEGLRQEISRVCSTELPQGARVAWMLPRSQEIFAWSTANHQRLVYGRDDLKAGPAYWILEEGGIGPGDYLVYYSLASPQRGPEQAAGTALLREITTRGSLFGPRSMMSAQDWFTRSVGFSPEANPAWSRMEEVTAWAMLYRVNGPYAMTAAELETLR